MRYTMIFLFSFHFFSCNSKKVSEPKIPLQGKRTIGYDSVKFNHKLEPDTSGYEWIIENRSILDTIELEKAVVVATSDTFLSLPKYKRLWSSPIPSKILVPNDTIIVSGFVYKIHPSNGGKGYPMLITQLIYCDKK